MNRLLSTALALTLSLIPAVEVIFNSSSVAQAPRKVAKVSRPKATAAANPQWIYVTSNDYATMYINKSSIRKLKNIRFFWQKLALKKRTPYEGTKEQVHGNLSYISLDCTGYVYRTRAFKIVGANNKVLYTLDPKKADNGVTQIFPGTKGDTQRKLVCST